MELWAVLRHRLRALLRRQQLEQDFHDELCFHIEMRERALRDAGLSPRDAERASRLAFGATAPLTETLRDAWTFRWFEALLQDLRYATRQLRKAPGFASTTVLSLAIGIGATTAVFSILYVTILHPYPFRDWERLVTLTVQDPNGNTRWPAITGSQLQRLREARSIEEVIATDQQELSTSGGDLPEDVSVMYWTTNATAYFGVPPALGRGLVASDAPDGAEPQQVAFISYLFWQRHFGGDPSILEQRIELAHVPYRIVGVQSPYLTWGGADVYLPLQVTADPRARLSTSIRLKPGVTPQMADGDLQPLLDAFAKETPLNFPRGFRADIRPLSYDIRTGLGPSMYLMFGAVCLLLLIGCLNIAILLMARGTRRQYELAIRAALGAGRARVARQLLTEAALLAAIGEALGIALASGTQKVLIWQLPSYLTQRQALVTINLPVLLFSIAAALVTVVAFGLLPAIQLSRRNLRDVMQLGERKLAGGWGTRTRTLLIAGQVALSVVLLAAAATSVRTFLDLLHTPLGYDPQHTLVLGIPLHPNSYTTWQARATYFDQLEQRLASTPDVSVVAFAINGVPPGAGITAGFEILGQNLLGDQQARVSFVGQKYFGLLKIPLVQGRMWDRAELARGAHVAVINQAMARRYWPNGDALLHSVRLPQLVAVPAAQVVAPGSNEWTQIVGIAGDALNDGLRNPIRPAIYLPYTARMPSFAQLLVRGRGNPLVLLHTLRAQVQAVDAEQQIARNALSLEDWLAQQNEWQREHTVALLFAAFSLVTVLLAAIGVFSVVSYTVALRTTEFALRMALDAQRRDVVNEVLASIATPMTIGLAAGVSLHFVTQRVVAQWTDAAKAPDAVVLWSVVLLLSTVAVLACVLPARRALTVEPIYALRGLDQ
jgi:predicted permease